MGFIRNEITCNFRNSNDTAHGFASKEKILESMEIHREKHVAQFHINSSDSKRHY